MRGHVDISTPHGPRCDAQGVATVPFIVEGKGLVPVVRGKGEDAPLIGKALIPVDGGKHFAFEADGESGGVNHSQ